MHKKHIEGDCKSRLTSFCVNAPHFEYACWCQVACQGERTWKLTGDVMNMYINGQGYVDGVEFEKTLYASPYMVMDEQEYTKHYYIEGERVCSKIGSGFATAPTNPTSTPIGFIHNYPDQISYDLWQMVLRGVVCSEFNPNNVFIEKKLMPAGTGDNGYEEQQYFYHPDHIGSSSFITDAIGYATQHLQYLPFGETFVDQQNGYDSRYTFSAKEKDDETQYSYFGARYYDSDLSVWLSVDPMSDKYPSTSGYMYVLGNPLNLVDPNGMDTAFVNDQARMYVKDAMAKDPEFAARVHELSESDVMYNFNCIGTATSSDEGQIGELRSDGEQIFIDFSYVEDDRYGEYENLYHETEHATQFEHGEFGFYLNNGKWMADDFFDLSEEVKAKDYAVKAPGTADYIRSSWEGKSTEKKMNYLKRFGYKTLYERTIKDDSYGRNNFPSLEGGQQTKRMSNGITGRFFKTYIAR